MDEEGKDLPQNEETEETAKTEDALNQENNADAADAVENETADAEESNNIAEDDTTENISETEEADSGGIDLIDFSEINQAVSSFDFKKASELISSVWNEDCTDIRIIVYKYFSEIFLKNYQDLQTTLQSFYDTLEKLDKSTLTPQKNLDRQIENSCKWFFKSLIEGIREYNKQKKYTTSNVDELVELYDKLEKLFSSKYGQEFSSEINHAKEVTAIPEEIAPEENAEENKPVEKSSVDDLADISQGSGKWNCLKNKIVIFRQLMNGERFLEAALFYKDINDEVVNFDPREYFPDVFFPLYEAMSKKFDNVLDILDQQHDTMQWFITEQLHRINSALLLGNDEIISMKNPDHYKKLSAYLQQMNEIPKNEELLKPDLTESAGSQNENYKNYDQDNMQNNPYSSEPEQYDDNIT